MLETKLSRGLKIDELLGQTLSSIEMASTSSEPPPFHKWVVGLSLDGRPFAYDMHDYLIDVYKDDHPDITFLKATQMGLTSYAMLRSIYGCRYGGYRNILYYFPSKSDVTEFVKGRVNPLIDENPNSIGLWIRDTNSTSIKRIASGFVYFRGMRSVVGMKSVPGDMVVYDELDEAPQDSVYKIIKRMAHSEYEESLKLSNPTLPDYGIDLSFQVTDQQFWLLKCPKCGQYTCLVETFPECLVEYRNKVVRLCQSCRDCELDISQGEWVARKPRIADKRGKQFSQLWSHYVSPESILADFRSTKNMADFYNLTIGIAYVEAENRLSREEVLALCGSDGIQSADIGPCYMGVDQGNDLHVIIGKQHSQKAGELIHIGVYREWEELDALMNNFKVVRCVVDALPETRNARAFANRFPGRVFICYYNLHQKGHYAWDEKNYIVSCNRTESLDASHKEIRDGELVLPKECDIVRDFADQLHNVAKKLEEEEEEGVRKRALYIKRYVYVKLGAGLPDHFRHAYNYEAIARHNSPQFLFPEFA